MTAPKFLIVKHIMLYARCHTVFLNCLNVRHAQCCCKKWVFAHVFKVSAIKRRSCNIYTGTENHIFVSVQTFFSKSLTVLRRQIDIPCRSKSRERRKGGTRIVRPSGIAPVVPVYLGTHSVRTVAHVQLRNSKPRTSRTCKLALRVAHCDFFFSRHSAQSILNATFNRLCFIKIHRQLSQNRLGNQCHHQYCNYFLHIIFLTNYIYFYTCRRKYSAGRREFNLSGIAVVLNDHQTFSIECTAAVNLESL